ncbi:MAG: tRNA/rRNA methyltransferase [Alcanivoracaceae bacterium]|nr:tRNA/rRNA methyltransferase [Alcanivoracaceae bacterium]
MPDYSAAPLLPALTFILVEPARQTNIGAAARAIKAMGFSELRITGAGRADTEAYWVAHHSQDILDQVAYFGTLEAALSDVDFSIATSARDRAVKRHYMPPEQAASVIAAKTASIGRAALVFGRESSGLRNDEIDLCDAVSSVPLAQAQPSLNLGQAVMLYAWCLHRVRRTIADANGADPAAYRAARERLISLLATTGLDQHRALGGWLLERLALADDYDLGMLMTLLERLAPAQTP